MTETWGILCDELSQFNYHVHLGETLDGQYRRNCAILAKIEAAFIRDPTYIPTLDQVHKLKCLTNHGRSIRIICNEILRLKASSLSVPANEIKITDVPVIVCKINTRLDDIDASGILETFGDALCGPQGRAALEYMRAHARPPVNLK